MEQQQDQLRAFLAAVRQRWFADEAMRAIGLAGIATAAPAMAGLVLYWLWAPAGAALVFLAAAAALVSAAGAATVLFRMQPRPDDRHVARFIEERAAAVPGVESFDDALVTAVETAESVNSRAPYRFKIDQSWDQPNDPSQGWCGSDHYMYARYGMPVLFFVSAVWYIEYHMVSDEPQYLDYDHSARVGRFVKEIMTAAANRPARLALLPADKQDKSAKCGG